MNKDDRKSLREIVPTEKERLMFHELRIKEKDLKRRRFKATEHNIYECLKSLYLFLIGIPLAFIFWLAYKGVYLSGIVKTYPAMNGICFIILVFFYGCIFHDLINPFMKRNYMEVPTK